MNIGACIARMYEIKKEKADLNKVIKELDEELEHIEADLIEKSLLSREISLKQ
jgi:septal ring factor EnvC (AmiA/AmiB activator)